MDVKGDLDVCRTITARRADLQLQESAAIAAALNIERHSAFHQRVSTDGMGNKDVNLPDATTLPEGWSMFIQNFGGVDSLVVKDDGGNILHTIGPGVACYFILLDSGTSNGTWFNYCVNEPSERYCDDFIIADFAAAVGGYHTYTLTAATHGRGTTPIVQVSETVGGNHDITIPDRIRIAANGDIEIRVTADDGETPSVDCRFDGRLCVI